MLPLSPDMQELLTEIGRAAAALAAINLAQQSFGAIEAVELDRVDYDEAEGEIHYIMRWRALSMGSLHSTVGMVILPEFLEGEDSSPEWLTEQMASFIVEKVLADEADGDE